MWPQSAKTILFISVKRNFAFFFLSWSNIANSDSSCCHKITISKCVWNNPDLLNKTRKAVTSDICPCYSAAGLACYTALEHIGNTIYRSKCSRHRFPPEYTQLCLHQIWLYALEFHQPVTCLDLFMHVCVCDCWLAIQPQQKQRFPLILVPTDSAEPPLASLSRAKPNWTHLCCKPELRGEPKRAALMRPAGLCRTTTQTATLTTTEKKPYGVKLTLHKHKPDNVSIPLKLIVMF